MPYQCRFQNSKIRTLMFKPIINDRFFCGFSKNKPILLKKAIINILN